MMEICWTHKGTWSSLHILQLLQHEQYIVYDMHSIACITIETLLCIAVYCCV